MERFAFLHVISYAQRPVKEFCKRKQWLKRGDTHNGLHFKLHFRQTKSQMQDNNIFEVQKNYIDKD